MFSLARKKNDVRAGEKPKNNLLMMAGSLGLMVLALFNCFQLQPSNLNFPFSWCSRSAKQPFQHGLGSTFKSPWH